MEAKLSENEKQLLLEKFKVLKTVRQKIDFWNKQMPMNYVQFYEDFNNLEELHPFKIAADEKEYEFLNTWFLENYLKLSKDKKKGSKLLVLSNLQKKFKQDLKTAKDKSLAVRKEIREVVESFKEYPVNKVLIKTNLKYNADHKAYEDYLNYRIPPDYSKIYPSLQSLVFENGKTLAQYKLYLEQELVKYSSKQTTEHEGVILTIKQFGLYFSYTLLLDKLGQEDRTYLAEILTPILGYNYKGVYDALREIEENKTKENLEQVKKYMVANDLEKYVPRVDKDLLNLSKSLKNKK